MFVSLLILLQLASVSNPTPGKWEKTLATAPGLVAAYGFEEGTGTTLSDASGNANNGTLQNGAIWVTGGRIGKALRFDGVNDLVSVADSNSLDLTNGMTLEAWVYPTGSMSGWDAILIKEYSTGLLYSLYANGDGNVPGTYISSHNTEYGMGGTSTLPLNTWTYLTSTFDGSTIRLYVNGVQVKHIPLVEAFKPPATGCSSVEAPSGAMKDFQGSSMKSGSTTAPFQPVRSTRT